MRPRLAVSMLLATVLLAVVLALLKIPEIAHHEAPELVVQLRPEVLDEAEEPAAAAEAPPLVAEAEAPGIDEAIIDKSVAAEPRAAFAPDTNWQEVIESAARETVAAMHGDTSMHPAHAEAKRIAAIRFAPSRAPIKKPIWENVEEDQMGRKVLRDGNCYRVLEDWRATYQDIQREFGQFIRYCDAVEDFVIDTGWMDDIRQEYAYLRNKDGEISRSELDALLRRPEMLAQE